MLLNRRLARSRVGHAVTVAVAAVLALTAVPAGPASAASADQRTVPAAFFGMHDGYADESSWPTAPIGSLRLWDTGVAWRDIQPSRTEGWRVHRLDVLVQASVAHGAEPVLVLGGSPAWASARVIPGSGGSAAAFLGMSAADPPRLDAWAHYVRFLVGRYKSRGVHRYEIWNEPNVLRFWNGSPAQMAQLTSIAAKVIKSVDAHATVLSPSFVVRLPTQQRWLAAFVRAGGLKQVDALALHLYPTADKTPEQSLELLAWARRLMKADHIEKPVWNTEINYGLAGGGQPAQTYSPALGAAYVARTYLLNADSGVARVHWYAWTHGDILGVQMTEPDSIAPTAAAAAFATTRRWLAGQVLDGCTRDRRATYRCRIITARTVGWVYWNPTSYRPIVKAPNGTYQFEYLDGSYPGHQGGDRLLVGKAPILIRVHR